MVPKIYGWLTKCIIFKIHTQSARIDLLDNMRVHDGSMNTINVLQKFWRKHTGLSYNFNDKDPEELFNDKPSLHKLPHLRK